MLAVHRRRLPLVLRAVADVARQASRDTWLLAGETLAILIVGLLLLLPGRRA